MKKLIGKSTRFKEMMRTVDIIAALDMPIFLYGKIGTGKREVAQYIQAKSNTSELISLNCLNLDDDFLSSILDLKSASVYLNEISELSLNAQACLLDFINNKKELRLIFASLFQVQQIWF